MLLGQHDELLVASPLKPGKRLLLCLLFRTHWMDVKHPSSLVTENFTKTFVYKVAYLCLYFEKLGEMQRCLKKPQISRNYA